MVVDTRFAVATHTMSVLAFMEEQYVSATFIGEQISINPVIVRRTLSLLGKAKLVKSAGGSKGGSKLAKPSSKITLLEIYRAIHPKRPFEKVQGFPKSNCEEGRRVDRALLNLFNDANSSLEKVLAQKILASLLTETRK